MSPRDGDRAHVGPRLVLALGLIPLLLLTAGCTSPFTDDLSDDDIETELDEATPPDEFSATVEVREVIDGETSTETETVWLRADGASRVETEPETESETGSAANDTSVLVVTDGETRWHYDRETETVTQLERDSNTSSWLDGLYAQQDRYIEAYDIADVTEASVDGRDSYRVTFEPPANETVEQSLDILVGQTEYAVPLSTSEQPEERGVDRVEVWFDQETMFPLKHLVEGEEGDLVLETTYRNVSVDPEPPLDDDLFEFSPPADAAIEDGETGSESGPGAETATNTNSSDNATPSESTGDGTGDGTGESDTTGSGDGDGDSGDGDSGSGGTIALPSIDHYDSITAADETVSFPVAEPPSDALPAAVERERISRYEFPDEDRRQVTLLYAADDTGGTISVTTSDGPRTFAMDGSKLPIGDVTGSIAHTDEGTELQWACGEHYRSVFVSHEFENGTAIELARAIGCQ
ncbi:LolA family protein [Natrialba taiwanensis]|uniref:Outer membrane lipoprotein carrier protein LolA n=1 Tax=Natrialba taiwanensis DSM 12281 TaxID=1230458 RepID=M0A2B8_9EURY|nr:outer membrane lipoprotein carrier protein LolA [Natrialba taiwanensis]ELY92456.1 hypothetical protein C484_09129 [Natrialba taiwanensis DSM 12281]